MSLTISVTAEATEDAITIAELLAGRSSFNTSDRFLNVTTQAYRRLAEMPGIGSPRNYGQNFSGLRMWHIPEFPKYLIFTARSTRNSRSCASCTERRISSRFSAAPKKKNSHAHRIPCPAAMRRSGTAVYSLKRRKPMALETITREEFDRRLTQSTEQMRQKRLTLEAHAAEREDLIGRYSSVLERLEAEEGQ